LAELLFWPALLAYGEAAVAYLGEVRRPGRPGRLATWGVRVGWLVQTALLALQAERAEGFPWTSWAGVLNLFSWLVVSAYLVWGCRARYRLLGLAVMPLALALFALARAGGGTELGGRSDLSNLFLVLHVGLLLAAFAGFALAAALAALYLWQERRLKRHAAGVLRVRVPPLAALDGVVVRTVVVALPALTLGIAAGLARLSSHDRFGPVIAATLLTWLVYLGFVVARFGFSVRGRRSAQFAVAAFALVAVVLPLAHFS
jgi:ABC-type uncharacterized transport system permease subunit